MAVPTALREAPAPGASEYHTARDDDARNQPSVAAVVLADEPLTGQALAAAVRSSRLVDATYQPDLGHAAAALAADPDHVLLWVTEVMDERTLARVADLRRVRDGVGVCLVAREFSLPGIHRLALADATRLSVLLRTERLTMVDVVRSLARLRGRTVTLSPDVLRAIAQAGQRDDARLAVLTPDERAVLELAAEGLRNCAIARRLHRSEKLIEKRIGCIFSKLQLNRDGHDGIDRRVAAARIYLTEQRQANVISA